MKAELIDYQGSDLKVVNAARESFDKQSKEFTEKDARLIRYLAEHQHMTPFEHCNVTMRIKVPIFVARQIQRHRTFSYSEVSRRYVDDNLEFYIPEGFRKRAENAKQGSSTELVDNYKVMQTYTAWIQASINHYNYMLEEGVAPEQARMILPQSLFTEFWQSGDLRAWTHFLKLRLDYHAQAEIREVADQMAKIIEPLFPVSYSALMSK